MPGTFPSIEIVGIIRDMEEKPTCPPFLVDSFMLLSGHEMHLCVYNRKAYVVFEGVILTSELFDDANDFHDIIGLEFEIMWAELTNTGGAPTGHDWIHYCSRHPREASMYRGIRRAISARLSPENSPRGTP